MGTSSFIGIKRDDDTIIGVYCNFDGYPNHMVPVLTKFYNTEKKIMKLIEYGNMSFLGETIKECDFYQRSDPELEKAVIYINEKELNEGWEYNYRYVFIKDKWYYSDYDRKFIDCRKWKLKEKLSEL